MGRLLLLTFLLCISTLGIACPSWQANIKNDQPSGWDYQLNPQDITLLPDPKDTTSQVTKLTITPDSAWPNGHTRVELKHNGCTTDEGENSYFSWEFYLDKPITTTNNIAYWETDKTYRQSMGFYLQPFKNSGEHKEANNEEKNGELKGKGRNNHKESSKLSFFTSLPSLKVHWQGTVKVATWNKIALAITWSEAEQKGLVSVWFNGKNVVKALRVKTKPDANKLFIQLGLHRNQAQDTIDSIYLRNVREAASLEQLLRM